MLLIGFHPGRPLAKYGSSMRGRTHHRFILDCVEQTKKGLGFMKPLVADMIQSDPSKRPAMDEVIARFDNICRSLSRWKLRSR
ncbi:hypothetical protein EV363DRAFT_1131233, partial [Boletus edulis]